MSNDIKHGGHGQDLERKSIDHRPLTKPAEPQPKTPSPAPTPPQQPVKK